MKKVLFFTCLVLLLFSCKKENKYSFIAKYQAISGTWETNAISYDSSGITIFKTAPYNRLIINKYPEYQVYMDILKSIENGTINNIEQTHNKLELYFAAKYPSYS
jgi:hypothetical protein